MGSTVWVLCFLDLSHTKQRKAQSSLQKTFRGSWCFWHRGSFRNSLAACNLSHAISWSPSLSGIGLLLISSWAVSMPLWDTYRSSSALSPFWAAQSLTPPQAGDVSFPGNRQLLILQCQPRPTKKDSQYELKFHFSASTQEQEIKVSLFHSLIIQWEKQADFLLRMTVFLASSWHWMSRIFSFQFQANICRASPCWVFVLEGILNRPWSTIWSKGCKCSAHLL